MEKLYELEQGDELYIYTTGRRKGPPYIFLNYGHRVKRPRNGTVLASQNTGGLYTFRINQGVAQLRYHNLANPGESHRERYTTINEVGHHFTVTRIP